MKAGIETKYELVLCQRNTFERIQRLQQPGTQHKYAERIDKDITAASLAAEQRIPRYREAQWWMKLASARRKV